MPDYIRQWKINNQIADLRDGTKGQPNGAVPLDENGKISYSLANYDAAQIPVSRDLNLSLLEWASRVAGDTVLPTPDSWETIFWLNCDLIKCFNGTYIAAGTSGIYVSTDGVSFSYTNVTSWSSWSSLAVYIFDIKYLGAVYFVLTNIGLWASSDTKTWTRVCENSTSHIAYDGTRYVANCHLDGKELANSADGFTWTADTFFTAFGELDLVNHTVDGVWCVDNVWWINAYYSAGNYYALFFYDGTHFSMPVTVGATQDVTWKYIHHTHNIDGLLQGDVWIIASEGNNGYSVMYCSETLYGVQWRRMTSIASVTTDFVEHKGVLYIGNISGVAYMDPVGDYYFYTRRLSDVIGQNPCRSLESTGELLLVCGGTKLLYSQEGSRWYKGLDGFACYSLACTEHRVVLACSTLQVCGADINIPVPLFL